MTVNVTVNIIPGREYQISSTDPGVSFVYDGFTIPNNGRFIGGTSQQVTVTTTSPRVGVFSLTEYLRNWYDPDPSQGGAISYRDGWRCINGYYPDRFGTLANRLVTFKRGLPWTHDGEPCTFFGAKQDAVVAFPSVEDGVTPKVYQSFSVQGTAPELVHIRTESDRVQSSDIAQFRNREGVHYSAILRDRLSLSSAEEGLLTGDPMRGETGLFQVNYRTTSPSSNPNRETELRFVNIGSVPSKGQTV